MRIVAIAALAAAAIGCGSRCREVASARAALASRVGAADRRADLRVVVPLARADALIEELLRAQPMTVALDAPELGPLPIAVRTGLTATVREVRLQPAPRDQIGFAVRIEIADGDGALATLALVVMVTPELTRADGAAALAIGFGPENLQAVTPELGPDARAALGAVVARRLPAAVRATVPRAVIDAAAARLASYLTGAAYQGLQRTLLPRLGELTRVRVQLPDVPIADVALGSTDDALYVDVLTDLPVRRGLAPMGPAGDDVAVELAGSAVAELANWAIDAGHAPRWYDRGLTARLDGEFRPRFDYVAEDTGHPFKVYAFQERGGCSYFRVGVRATIAMDGATVKATALDRDLEAKSASPVIEVAAWVKYFVVGSIDRSKQVAASTRVTVGAYTLTTEVVDAALAHDELRFALRIHATAGSRLP